MLKSLAIEEKMTGRLMTQEEQADITVRAFALRDAGKEDEAIALFKTIPMRHGWPRL
jgi:hypothetical protein